MINNKVIKIVENSGGNKDYILVYLLSLYFNLNSQMIPENVKDFTNRLGIIDRNYKKGTIKWLVPLFDSTITNEIVADWRWVHNEYRTLFMTIRSDAGGDKQGTLNKMKKFFSEHPDVRKDDILNAANSYLKPFNDGTNDPKFMQRADYFISKQVTGIGGNSVESRLIQYLEINKLNKIDTTENINSRMRGLI